VLDALSFDTCAHVPFNGIHADTWFRLVVL